MNALLPADIQAALNQLDPAFAKAFADAVAGVTSRAAVGQIEDAIARGDYQGAVDLLRINSQTFDGLQQQIMLGQWAGGGLVTVPPVKDPFTGQTIMLGFSGMHPRAMNWAVEAGSRLVTAIAEDQRTGIAEFIRASVEAGQGPRATALQIVGKINRATGIREGGIVGLTGQQMQWVANARAELSGPETAKLFLKRAARDKRFDRLIGKGEALGQADKDRIVQAYSSRLLKLRGEAIARTEALNALRAGKWEAWQQAIDSGKMTTGDLEVIWDATADKRTRHSHMVLDGKKVTFGQAFVTEHGSRLRFPGDASLGALAEDVIQCRCSYTVRRKRRGDL